MKKTEDAAETQIQEIVMALLELTGDFVAAIECDLI